MDTGDVLSMCAVSTFFSVNKKSFFSFSGKVPPDLQKLVRVVSRAFYQPEQNVVLDILTTYPW